LKKEVSIFTFRDLLYYFPFRHVDKTKVSLVQDIKPDTEYIQVSGTLLLPEILGTKYNRRMVAQLKDSTGSLELTWFQGISWLQKYLIPGNTYLVF